MVMVIAMHTKPVKNISGVPMAAEMDIPVHLLASFIPCMFVIVRIETASNLSVLLG